MQLYFDTHGHLNLEPLYRNWQTCKQEARAEGVRYIFVPGTNMESSLLSLKIAGQNSSMLGGVGIHPTDTYELDLDSTTRKLDTLISENRILVKGIGETGLDYFRMIDDEKKAQIIKTQKEFFRAHLELASRYNLPISIHVRDQDTPEGESSAYLDTLEIMQDYSQKVRWILHCASGPRKYIKEALKMGAYISFAGNVTYKNADNLRDLLALVPTDRILAETDAPYLAPLKLRGKICEPKMVVKTADFIADLRAASLDQLYQNSLEVFDLKEEALT